MIITGVHGSIGVSPGAPRRSPPGDGGGGALTGVVGSIRWGYYTAAGIHGYTVRCTPAGQWSLSATVVLSDAFKLAQCPLTFVAVLTKKGLDGICVVKTEWRWPIRSLSPIDPNTKQLTARLGPPEE